MTAPDPALPAERRARVGAELTARGLDALLVTDLRNVRYLTGFAGSAGVVALQADGSAVLATDSRYEMAVVDQAPGVDHRITREYLAACADWLGDRAGAGRGAVRVGVEADELTLARADGVREALVAAALPAETTPTSGVVESSRRGKDAAEVAAVARACEIADTAWTELLAAGRIRAGRTERAVAADLEYAMRTAGSDGVSFDTIVASGPHGALPHHDPGERELRDGELVVVDFGALHAGYASDCTRTVAVGEPSAELRAVHALVLRAQLAGVEAIRPGLSCAELDAVSRGIIDAAAHGDHFGHSLGHGVGLDVHEAPAISPRATGTLSVGDVVTIEPGVYLPGVGGVRIEDTVLVTEDGPRILTTTAKDLHCC